LIKPNHTNEPLVSLKNNKVENEYIKVMADRSNEDLIKIVTVDLEKYQPLAIEAAKAEIEKRNIDTTYFEQVKVNAKTEKGKVEKVDANVVGSGLRFINYLIDFFIVMILAFIASIILVLLFQSTDPDLGALIGFVLLIGTFVAYYAIMEIIFQKTIGKFITKTKVVKMNGEKPTEGDILMRTLCRMVPFDHISYLFMKNGFHDILSKTKVVKDTVD
jgi:uncharacterized RDD family membrane protein YckC